LPDEESL